MVNVADAKGSCLQTPASHDKFDAAEFPGNIRTASLPIVDFGGSQSLLYRSSNYRPRTSCDILEVAYNGSGQWLRGLDNDGFQQYLSVRVLKDMMSNRVWI